ncbi:MAG: hypothetical protein EOM55_00185 [Clostridia bacterium]|nr:hypothetical protein [Clostridia bacterium]
MRKRQCHNNYKKSNKKINYIIKNNALFDVTSVNKKNEKIGQEQIKLFQKYLKKANLDLSIDEIISIYLEYINNPKTSQEEVKYFNLSKFNCNSSYKKFSNIMDKVLQRTSLVDVKNYNYAKTKSSQEENKLNNKSPNKINFSVSQEDVMRAYLEYLKNPAKDTDVFKVLKKFWTPRYIEKMLFFYDHALDNPSFALFSLSPYTKDEFFEDPGKDQYFNNFLRAVWLNNEKNQKLMLDICNKKLKRTFPEVLEHYGIPDDYLFREIPNDKFTKKPECFVFTHSDEFLEDMISAPKIPLTEWETVRRDSFHTIQVKKVAFQVGEECMIGEFTRTYNYCGDDVVQNAGSSIKFCVYARGLERGKFVVSRWDYEPLGIHFNKLNNYGNIDLNGYLCEKTQHSHIHLYNLKQRLLLTQNQSADICPTPINCNSESIEKTYETFENMLKDFEWQHYFIDEKAPKISHNFYLKEYILDNCPLAIVNGKYIFEDDLSEKSGWNYTQKVDSQKYYLGKECENNCGKFERQMGE